MRPPKPPRIRRLDRITPAIYEAARSCTARAAWTVHGERGEVPRHPRTLLGVAVHAVLESARRGELVGGSPQERRQSARRAFDDKMGEIFANGHPLLQAKFDTYDRLPYYNLHRERAALIAAELAPHASSETTPGQGSQGSLVETTLASRDGRVVGRPDVVDRGAAAVIVYKTSSAPQGGEISDAEKRQLTIYAFLAGENGVEARKGVVLRTDRSRAEVEISPEAAQAEGVRAVEVLESYNRNVDRRFEEAASPAPAASVLPVHPILRSLLERGGRDVVRDRGFAS